MHHEMLLDMHHTVVFPLSCVLAMRLPILGNYENRFNTKIDRSNVLPSQHALQGHPESPRLWENHTNQILQLSDLDFKCTTALFAKN